MGAGEVSEFALACTLSPRHAEQPELLTQELQRKPKAITHPFDLKEFLSTELDEGEGGVARRHWLFHPWAEACVVLLVLASVVITALDFFVSQEVKDALAWVDISILVLFIAEITIRVSVLGFSRYFRRLLNLLDALVVALSLVFTIIATSGATFLVSARLVTRLLRVSRLVRLPVFLVRGKQRLSRFGQNIVSGNKQRTGGAGGDLDLTYITPTIIATSLPSDQRVEQMYRNPIDKVAQFLDTHHPHLYVVFNLCSERVYPTHFFHHRVLTFRFHDHEPPPLASLVGFTTVAREYLNSQAPEVTGEASGTELRNADAESQASTGSVGQRTVVVHCKGGKGRTGVMISALMIAVGTVPTAAEALELFSQKRTSSPGKKIQSVSNPSQIKYVRYFEKLHAHNLAVLPIPEPQFQIRSISFKHVSENLRAMLGRVEVTTMADVQHNSVTLGVASVDPHTLPATLVVTSYMPRGRVQSLRDSHGRIRERLKTGSRFGKKKGAGDSGSVPSDSEGGEAGKERGPGLDSLMEEGRLVDGSQSGDIEEDVESASDVGESRDSSGNQTQTDGVVGTEFDFSVYPLRELAAGSIPPSATSQETPPKTVDQAAGGSEQAAECIVQGDFRVALQDWSGNTFASFFLHSNFIVDEEHAGVDPGTGSEHRVQIAASELDVLGQRGHATRRALISSGLVVELTFVGL